MYFLDLLGTIAFAISGAFKAKGRQLNIFGVIFLGLITAVGGGTIRDLIIGRTPLFYLQDYNYIFLAVGSAVIAFFIPTFFSRRYSLFRFLDSVGLATFAIIGVSITFNHLYQEASVMASISSVFLGTLTGTGGGILRDSIMGDTPYALKHGSNYIASAFLGSIVFFALMFFNGYLAVIASMVVSLYAREIVSEYGIYKKIVKERKNADNQNK